MYKLGARKSLLMFWYMTWSRGTDLMVVVEKDFQSIVMVKVDFKLAWTLSFLAQSVKGLSPQVYSSTLEKNTFEKDTLKTFGLIFKKKGGTSSHYCKIRGLLQCGKQVDQSEQTYEVTARAVSQRESKRYGIRRYDASTTILQLDSTLASS